MRLRTFLGLMVGSLWCILTGACQSNPPTATGPAPAKVRVMTWNIHHAEGMDGVVDLPRIAALIRRQNPDVVALQEVDRGVSRTDRRDMPRELASLTGLSCLFSNNYPFDGGEYGNAILTRFPVVDWTNTHFQMLGPVEQRGVLQALLQVGDREIVFMNTHLDAQRNDAERLHETTQLLALREDYYAGHQIILCGDFNATPLHPVSTGLKTSFQDAWTLAGVGEGATVPVTNPQRRIDYIWLSKTATWRVRRIEVLATTASDHLAVVADLELLP